MTPEETVMAYLSATERRDEAAMRRHAAEPCQFTFPGGRAFSSVDQILANSHRRYRHVAKEVEAVESFKAERGVIVYVRGTLYGAFHDGAEFSGIRFVDRFEVVDGRITDQQVWNDIGEHLSNAGGAREEAKR